MKVSNDNMGASMARWLFKRKGNHSEMHVREDELAALLQSVYDLGKTVGMNNDVSVELNWKDKGRR